MYMNPDCSVCFSAMFLCASQLHHLVLPSIVLCASQLHHLVLLSFIILCFPASLLSSSQALIALLLGLNR